MGSKMKYRLVSLLVLIVLLMSEVYSQSCTCEIVDPYPRYFSGQEVWVGGLGRPVYVCVYHYYGDYKVIITFYDWDYNIIRQDEFINPIMYMEGCFWVEQPPFTEVVRVDLVILSEDSDVSVLWDFCVLCCPSTTTITTTEIVESTITETHTQFLHDTRAFIIIAVVVLILLWLIKR
jgi:hypothetical protein